MEAVVAKAAVAEQEVAEGVRSVLSLPCVSCARESFLGVEGLEEEVVLSLCRSWSRHEIPSSLDLQDFSWMTLPQCTTCDEVHQHPQVQSRGGYLRNATTDTTRHSPIISPRKLRNRVWLVLMYVAFLSLVSHVAHATSCSLTIMNSR